MGFYQPPQFGSNKPRFTGQELTVLEALTVTIQSVFLATTFTTTSTVPVDIVALVLTLPNRAGGFAMSSFVTSNSNVTASGATRTLIGVDGTDGQVFGTGSLGASDRTIVTVTAVSALDGTDIQARVYVASSTGSWFGGGGHNNSELFTFEVSG